MRGLLEVIDFFRYVAEAPLTLFTREMLHKSRNVKYLLSLVPGKRRFGTYRFLPFFFCLGGTMEWIMINVRIGKETFYDVYRRKQSEREYQQKIEDGLLVPQAPK